MLGRVKGSIERNHMFEPGDLVVVAVSGGPDSVALLNVLHALSPELSLRLHVAHLNHKLRGRASDVDADFVRVQAGKLNLPATIESIDVSSLRQRRRLGIEEAARLARYSFLAELAGKLGAVGVAVGHTVDDQVETVIMHWLRGSGLAGLRGMQPVSQLRIAGDGCGVGERRSLRICRPMLEVTRADVVSYCREAGLAARLDASNVDVRFTRNRIRRELLPILERYNPGIREAVLRTSRIASDDLDFIQSEMDKVWKEIAEQRGAEVILDLPAWRALPRSLQRQILREAIGRLCGDLLDVSASHIEAAISVIATRPAGSVVTWPHGLKVVKRYDDFVVSRPDSRQAALSADGQPLTIPGQTPIAGRRWTVVARISNGPCPEPEGPWHANLDAGITGLNLMVRRRRAGDRFQPLGMGQEKKLQDFLVDSKVPREERDSVPIVASPTQIVWVAGHRIDERAKATQQTERVLCLTFLPREE
mgnify:CR=1 FL=1